MTRVLRPLTALLLVACWGCSSKSKEIELFNGAPLPRPDRVLVYDFEITPQDVDPAHGVSARTRAAAAGASRSGEEIAAGRALAAALSENLVTAIREMGIGAARARIPELPTGNDLALRGQFLTVRQDDPSAAVQIGLAGARDEVHAEVQIYQDALRVEEFEEVVSHPRDDPAAQRAAATPPDSITAFEEAVEPRAGRNAGSGAVAAGAANRDAAGAAVPFGDDVDADARRAAAVLAKPLAAFFLREGWISAMPR